MEEGEQKMEEERKEEEEKMEEKKEKAENKLAVASLPLPPHDPSSPIGEKPRNSAAECVKRLQFKCVTYKLNRLFPMVSDSSQTGQLEP